MDLICSPVWTHDGPQLEFSLTGGTILFYMMANFIWGLMPPGDDYKVALNDEGTHSVIKPQ